jgi:hypothetical protein
MPDWNPDKEAHRDHKWIVHRAIRDTSFKTVNAADREMKFDREGRFSVSDEKIAAEIREKYPHTATVTRVNAQHSSDRGHKYFFNCPEMPWHKDGKDADKDRDEDFQEVC